MMEKKTAQPRGVDPSRYGPRDSAREPAITVLPQAPRPKPPRSRPDWAFVGLFILAALYAFHFARALLLPITLAVLFSLLLSPIVSWLRKWRVPEPAGAAVVLVALLSGIVTAFYSLAEPAAAWLEKAPESLTVAEDKVRKFLQPVTQVQRAADKIEAITRTTSSKKPREVVVQAPGFGVWITSQTPYLITGTVSTLVLLYFLLASGDLFLRKTVKLIPTLRNKIHAVEVGNEVQRELGRYFVTVSLINAGLGIATAIVMKALGMPNPLLWGALAMLLNYIPYLGPTVCLGVLSMAALMSFDDFSHIWPVPAAFVTLVVVEGQLVQPFIVGRSLSLNPVMVFSAFLVLGWLWGIAGMFVAVPILVTLKVVCDHVERFAAMGEYLGRN
ncbi:MAG TPA: AI-2E family transporter [Burkholderiales bacterium]|nr:AI-2E family transporter [Burkholderiales bacterium]